MFYQCDLHPYCIAFYLSLICYPFLLIWAMHSHPLCLLYRKIPWILSWTSYYLWSFRYFIVSCFVCHFFGHWQNLMIKPDLILCYLYFVYLYSSLEIYLYQNFVFHFLLHLDIITLISTLIYYCFLVNFCFLILN